MADFEYFDTPATTEQQVFVVPISRTAWIVDDDGEVDGPHPVAAVATTIITERIPGRVVGATTRNARIEFPLNPSDDVLSFAPVKFLVVPDAAGSWEELWFEQKYIVFSEAAAKTLANTRKQARPGRAKNSGDNSGR